MNKVVLLLCAITPIFLIIYYMYRKDREKEPIMLLITFFVLGILSVYMVIGIYTILNKIFPFLFLNSYNTTFLNTLIYTFIGIGLIEEFSKWLMVYKLGYNHKEFDEFYDMILYAVCVSLGFAVFENIIYILESGQIKTAILRAIFALPAHAYNGVFMGYHLSLAKYNSKHNKTKECKEIINSLLIPTILHGIYDFCLISRREILLYVFLIYTTNITMISIIKIKQISESKIVLKQKEK